MIADELEEKDVLLSRSPSRLFPSARPALTCGDIWHRPNKQGISMA